MIGSELSRRTSLRMALRFNARGDGFSLRRGLGGFVVESFTVGNSPHLRSGSEVQAGLCGFFLGRAHRTASRENVASVDIIDHDDSASGEHARAHAKRHQETQGHAAGGDQFEAICVHAFSLPSRS